MWIHQTGDMYECSECGAIEHVKPLWTRCPVCGEPGKAEKRKTIEDGLYHLPHDLADVITVTRHENCVIDPGYIKAVRKPSEEEWRAYAEKLQQEAVRIREEEEKKR